MPFVVSRGVRIHYEIEGEGQPLLLAHGLAGSLETWRDHGYTAALNFSRPRDFGYTDATSQGAAAPGPLGDSYRLILVDARGHGRSDKPYQPDAYRVETLVADVMAVLDELGLPKVHYWGYSLGAQVGFACAGRVPSRFASLILGGYAPYGVRSDGERKYAEFVSQTATMAVEGGTATYVAAIERASHPLPAVAKARFLANDPRALFAATRATYRWRGVGQVLSSLAVPCLLYAGADDLWHASIEEGARQIKGSTFVSLPGEDHFSTPYRSDLILPHVQRFLAGI
ncbi:MAG: alpha/beta fold hydrolase [Chloroflexota bacterium]